MEINNSPVFNPAATSRATVGTEPSKLSELARGGDEDDKKKKVESREKPETEAADGHVLETLKSAIDETVGLQTKQPPVDDDVIVELSSAAKAVSAQQAEEATKAKIATINAAANVFAGPDVATATFSNSGGSNTQVNLTI